MGVVVSLSQISYYDPETKTSDLAQKWRDLHRETRAAFVKETASIAVAHKSFRLRELGRMYRRAMSGARPTWCSRRSCWSSAPKKWARPTPTGASSARPIR
jgi:hypothetical protein